MEDDILDAEKIEEKLEEKENPYMMRNTGRYSFLTVEEEKNTVNAMIDRKNNTYEIKVPDAYEGPTRTLDTVELFEDRLDLDRQITVK